MEYYNPENRDSIRWASLAVVLYVVLLTLLMFLVRFNHEVPESVEAGLLVEFGEDDAGQGDEELVATDVVATPPPPQVERVEESIETDDRAEVSLPVEKVEQSQEVEQPQEIEQPVEQPDTVVEPKRVVNQKALFPGRKEVSTATSQGSTEGSGNQGAESGGESGGTEGGGEGDQSIVQLKDRSIVGILPKPAYGANAAGRVMIDITVDQTGRVKSATYRAQGSTTNNSQLVDAAQAAALKARFTPSDDFIQGGTITYIFKMN